MSGEMIQPQVFIVEDNDKIASALKRRLNIVNKANGYCLIPEYRLVRSAANFKQIIKEISKDNIAFSNVIVDINLDSQQQEGGLEVLKYLQSSYPQLVFPLVYTAYPSYRAKCNDLGVASDRFFVKSDGSFMEDIQQLKRKIEDVFLRAYTSNLIPGNLGLLVVNGNAKHSYFYVSIFFKPEDFVAKDEAEEILLFNFMSYKISPGLNVFALRERLWHFKAQEDGGGKIDQGSFVQDVNAETGRVEGFKLRLNGAAMYVGLPDFETLKTAHEIIFEYVRKENSVENRFAEFFLMRRMVDLYAASESVERAELVAFSLKAKYAESKMVFMFGIWEFIARTKHTTTENDQHHAFLEAYRQYEFIDMFYGEIEKLEVENGEDVAVVRLQSVEDADISFHRNFYLRVLKKFGLMHLQERFKLIYYTEINPFRQSFKIIPVSPNIVFK